MSYPFDSAVTPYGVPTSSSRAFQLPGLGASSTTQSLHVPPSSIPSTMLQLPPQLQGLPREQLTALLTHLQGLQNGDNATQALQHGFQLPIQQSNLAAVRENDHQSHKSQQLRAQEPTVYTEPYHQEHAMDCGSGSDSEADNILDDSDREEGELSDASMEMESPVASPVVARKRKFSTTSPENIRKTRRTSNDAMAEPDWAEEVVSNKQYALPFVMALHMEGVTFDQLLTEVKNEEFLRDIYRDLEIHVKRADKDIRTRPLDITQGIVVDRSNQTADPQASLTKATTLTTLTQPAPSSKTTTSNRSEYLARLNQLRASQSAKEPASKSQVAIHKPETTTSTKPKVVNAMSKDNTQTITPSSKQDSLPKTPKNPSMTELIRKKMEALKAQQKLREEVASKVAATQPSEGQDNGNETPVSLVESSHFKRRPVAADFLESLEPQITASFSRPFGQSRSNSEEDAMIIEVSDDETADADDELGNETVDSEDRFEPIAPAVSTREQRIRDFPPLRDFPSSASFMRSNGTPMRTPAVQTPGAASELEALKKQEAEIAALKLRIADAQAQKRRLAATKITGPDQVSLSTQATQASDVKDIHGAIGKNDNSKTLVAGGADAVHAAIETPSLTSTLSITAPVAASLEHVAGTGAVSKMRANLSAKNAAIEAKRAQMAAMQRHLEQMQRDLEEEVQAQEQLRAELETFNVDTEGMTKEEMEAKKDEIVQQLEESNDLSAEMHEPVATSETLTRDLLSHATGPVVDIGVSTPTPELMQQSIDDHDPNMLEDAAMDESSESEDDQVSECQTLAKATDPIETGPDVATTDMLIHGETATMDTSLSEKDSSSQPRREPRIEIEDDSDAMDMDTDDASDKIGQSSSSDDPGSESESESESEDDDQSVQDAIVRAPREDAGSDTSESDSEEEYEPGPNTMPDEAQSKKEMSATKTQSERHMPALDGNDDHDDDTSMDESDYEPTSEMNDQTNTSTAVSEVRTSGSQSDTTSRAPSSDLAPELQTSKEKLHADASIGTTIDAIVTRDYFKPYDSQLKKFKKYRFHPDYVIETPGGFRSHTYSHRIDAFAMLCPYEGHGGACNDSTCSYQHFRDMELHDDKLLAELGTNAMIDEQTAEEKDRFKAGLLTIVHEFREQNTADVELVARRISDYRRDFLSDRSRVLGLPEYNK